MTICHSKFSEYKLFTLTILIPKPHTPVGSPVGSTSSPTSLEGSFSGSSNTPSPPMRMGSTTGSTPPPPRAGSYLGSAFSVPMGSNPEQPKPGSASLVTDTLGDGPRSSNVADLVRTFEKVKVKTNVRGSDKRKRRQARWAEASAALAQPSTLTGSEKRVSVPNTGRLDGKGEQGSAERNIKTPVQSSEAKAGEPEAQPSREKASLCLQQREQEPPAPHPMIPCVWLSDHAPIPNKWNRVQLVREATRRRHQETELCSWRANGALFFCATKALIRWDPPSSAADPTTKGPKDQPMETTVSVKYESTPAEGVERQPTAEKCHTAEEGHETEALFDPEDVTLTEVFRQSLRDKIAVSIPCSSEPLRLLQANIQHERASTALLCKRLREFDINISLIQEPWAYQGLAGGSLFYCTSEARPRAYIQAKNVDATLLAGFCHRDLVAARIKEVGDSNGKTRDVIRISAHLLHALAGNSYAKDSRYRNPRATRWNLYKEELEERLGIMPTRYGSEEEIETFANCLNSAILSSYEASYPLKKVEQNSMVELTNRVPPQESYCQGFNMLAALILQVTERCESDALKLMIYLVEGVLPDCYFADNLRGLSVDMAVFRELLRSRLPRLSKHLDTLQNAAKDGSRSYEPPLTNVFTMQWFLTLFCNCLPQPTVLRVWDLILLEGNEILLRTALAIWQVLAERILSARSADEFYCIMGVLMRDLLEFSLIDGNSLIKAVVTIGPLSELKTLREHYMYNINPWGANLPHTVEKQLKLYPRHTLALDISSLKKQYAKLKQRQRQAHIIFSAAISRQPPPIPPATMNHLLIGKSALVPAKRLGPPKGSIPPSRQVPSTLHWKDAPKQTSSSSSSDTELCDDESAESSDEDGGVQSQFDNLPYDSDTNLMKNDNICASIKVGEDLSSTPSQIAETESVEERDNIVEVKSESDDDNFDFEQFLSDRVKCLKVGEDDQEDRMNCARRNSERALQIIQENSLILHRILQCQSRLSPSPPLQTIDPITGTDSASSFFHGELPLNSESEIDTSYDSIQESQNQIDKDNSALSKDAKDLKLSEYGSKYTSILEKSKSLDAKYNALILNRPTSQTVDELSSHITDETDIPRFCAIDKNHHSSDQYKNRQDYNFSSSGNSINTANENLPIVFEETINENYCTSTKNQTTKPHQTGSPTSFPFETNLESIRTDSYVQGIFSNKSFNTCTDIESKVSSAQDTDKDQPPYFLTETNDSLIKNKTFIAEKESGEDIPLEVCNEIVPDVSLKSSVESVHDIFGFPDQTHPSGDDNEFKEISDSKFNFIDTDFRNYLFLSNEEYTHDDDLQMEITPPIETADSALMQFVNSRSENEDFSVSPGTDSMSMVKDTSRYFSAQSEAASSGEYYSSSKESKQRCDDFFLTSPNAEPNPQICYTNLDPKIELEKDERGTPTLSSVRRSEEKSPTGSKTSSHDVNDYSPSTKRGSFPNINIDVSDTKQKKPSVLEVVRLGESSMIKSPRRTPLKSPSKSPLKSPSKYFNPFPVPLSSRQSKEVPLKLGLYKK
ncbi:hypothetical protein JTB14_001896 [Gonioctena quinquepunctata]|nr:hypothetical protein JTB14_001896 [Gonioctena quinquepunctata]